MKSSMRGNCYVTSEALYHLLGGKKAGWVPMRMRIGVETHWFLQHRESGLRIDATASQFLTPQDYSTARGSGFLTREPSRRARMLMNTMVWQTPVGVSR